MGVPFLHNIDSSMFKDNHGEKLAEIEICDYKNDVVYRECSLPKVTNKLRTKTSRKVLKVTKRNVKTESYDKFSWTKVYRSPIPMRSNEDKKELNKIASTAVLPSNSEKNIDKNSVCIIQVTTQTSMQTLPILSSSIQNTRLCSKIKPKLLCPCCCGGDDQIQTYDQPYRCQQATDSFESIKLNTPTTVSASFTSILSLQRRLKRTKNTVMFSRILTRIVRNTFNNFITKFNFKKCFSIRHVV
ncbi:unnamed protein product [Euphydryas editha]|uniref:Uncharacterized protein n=1 Tax=Euphydryas editha TaxID=104508 RepID=A0AAU9U9V3_EUPED|nr:unnamed protein product [Euphydryas editha]